MQRALHSHLPAKRFREQRGAEALDGSGSLPHRPRRPLRPGKKGVQATNDLALLVHGREF